MAVLQVSKLQFIAQPACERTCIVIHQLIVISKFGSSVQQELANVLTSRKVCCQGVHQFRHGQVFFFEYADIDRGEGIRHIGWAGNCADREFMRSCSLLQIFPFLNTARRETRSRKCRQQICVTCLDPRKNLQPLHRKIMNLCAECFYHLAHGRKGPHIACMKTDLFFRNRIQTIIQCNFKNFIRVEETHIGIFIGNARHHIFHTTTDTVFARFFDIVTHREQVWNTYIVIEERRMTISTSYALQGQAECIAVDVVMVAERHSRFFGRHFQNRAEDQVCQRIAGVFPIRFLST